MQQRTTMPKTNRKPGQNLLLAAGVAAGVGAAVAVRHRRSRMDLLGKVVVITGGSRGLGFALAEECARQGANVAICARDEAELNSAQQEIERLFGVPVYAVVCDISNNDEVLEFISGVRDRSGHIDVLINNAGTITVGPMQSQTLTDYQEAMDTMYWGVVYPTLAVLPGMMERRSGRIANITSFGGKVAVPHLLPYSAAKFAAVGFSEGMRAEVNRLGIKVTTVCPWLMRTGSHLNAHFKGQHRKEFTWFSLGATLPVVSMDARRAARKIIDAVKLGQAELILSPQGKLAIKFHGVFPGITSNLLSLVNRVLPKHGGDRNVRRKGHESQTILTRSPIEKLGQNAARQLHQHSGAEGNDRLGDRRRIAWP